MVDYRFTVQNNTDFELILKAVKKISNKLYLPIIITGSSNCYSDVVLDKKKYKIVGIDRPIICNINDYRKYKTDILRREFIFSTLADSDGEYLM